MIEGETMTLEAPEFYAEHARGARARGDYQGAAALFKVAAQASAGHKRRARYLEAAEHCLQMIEGGDK